MKRLNTICVTMFALVLLLGAGMLRADYVELGSGGSLLMNVPFCGG